MEYGNRVPKCCWSREGSLFGPVSLFFFPQGIVLEPVWRINQNGIPGQKNDSLPVWTALWVGLAFRSKEVKHQLTLVFMNATTSSWESKLVTTKVFPPCSLHCWQLVTLTLQIIVYTALGIRKRFSHFETLIPFYFFRPCLKVKGTMRGDLWRAETIKR